MSSGNYRFLGWSGSLTARSRRLWHEQPRRPVSAASVTRPAAEVHAHVCGRISWTSWLRLSRRRHGEQHGGDRVGRTSTILIAGSQRRGRQSPCGGMRRDLGILVTARVQRDLLTGLAMRKKRSNARPYDGDDVDGVEAVRRVLSHRPAMHSIYHLFSKKLF